MYIDSGYYLSQLAKEIGWGNPMVNTLNKITKKFPVIGDY